MMPEIARYGSVLPDFNHVDLNGMAAKRNALVLLELHSRAINKQNLLEGMGEYVGYMTHALRMESLGMVRPMFGNQRQ